VTWGLLGAVALSGFGLPVLARHLRAVGVLLGAIGVADPSGLTQRFCHPLREQELALGVPGCDTRARWYAPSDLREPRGVLLLPGVHHLGIDEPRFRRMARALAAAGFSVLTPELSELSNYRIGPATIDTIEACARYHAEKTGGPVGAWGISFGGGLLLLAAKRAGRPPAFAYVVAIGAHHDLLRLARYYAGLPVAAPDAKPPNVEPHPYGARVMIHAFVEGLFRPDSVDLARQALRFYVEDRFVEARSAAARLTGEDGIRLRRLLDGSKDEIASDLMRMVDIHASELEAISPRGQLAALGVPTFLLHGTLDSVIPSLETEHLARDVPAAVLRRALVTPVLGHADLTEKLPWRDYLDLVRWTAAVLDIAER
jgi:pimeloyl-ACP methyl ester carboxylesterase